MLANYQVRNGMNKLTLKQDVPTRLNSSYLMIVSIFNNYDGVKFALHNHKGKYLIDSGHKGFMFFEG